MSIDTQFNATCTIQRRQYASAQDNWGQDTGKYTYANNSTANRCRLEGLMEREIRDTHEAIVATKRLFLPTGVGVVQTDRITSVTTDEGTAVGGTYEVQSVDLWPGGTNNHIEALLIEVV